MLRSFPLRLPVPLFVCDRLIGLFAFLMLVAPTGAQEATAGKKGDKQSAAKNMEDEMVEGVKAFFAADFGDTDVKIAENQKKAFGELAKKFNGREVTLVFRIANISSEENRYRLMLGDLEKWRVRNGNGPGSLQYVYLGLTKEQALGVSKESRLEISGAMRLRTSVSPLSVDLSSKVTPEMPAIQWVMEQ